MAKNILVNEKKVARAEAIIASFKKSPKTPETVALRDKFIALIKEDEVDPEDQLEYVYTKLGGLVRTPEEESAAQEKARKLREDYDKNGKGDEDDE